MKRFLFIFVILNFIFATFYPYTLMGLTGQRASTQQNKYIPPVSKPITEKLTNTN